MNSKSFKFMCVNVGLLALSYVAINTINIVQAFSIQEVEEIKEKTIGFNVEEG